MEEQKKKSVPKKQVIEILYVHLKALYTVQSVLISLIISAIVLI